MSNPYQEMNQRWFQAAIEDYKKFLEMLDEPPKTQEELLFNILKKNQDSELGKRYDLQDIKSIEDFQNKIPLSTFEDYHEYVARLMDGEQGLLSGEDVFLLEPTSGSVGTKFIPMTQSFKEAFQFGINIWFADLMKGYPGIENGSHYWSITPSVDYKLESKIPVGFDEDSKYLNDDLSGMISRLAPVPSQVLKIKNGDNFFYATLLFLITSSDLSFISIWSPTFLLLLLDKITQYKNFLVEDINNHRFRLPFDKEEESLFQSLKTSFESKDYDRDTISSILFKEKKEYHHLWKNLKVISCWGDAYAENYIDELKRLFPNTVIQPKGLLATEAFMSIPLKSSKYPVLAVGCHFYEFRDIDTDNILLVDGLELGKRYSIIITTQNGFCRYQMRDIIQVVGYYHNTPMFRFIGKEEKVLDYFGEKVDEVFVDDIFNKIEQQYNIKSNFRAVSCEKDENDRYSYTFFMESPNDISDGLKSIIETRVELELLKNVHYQYARRLEQLKSATFKKVPKGAAGKVMLRHQDKNRIGGIKPFILLNGNDWTKILLSTS